MKNKKNTFLKVILTIIILIPGVLLTAENVSAGEDHYFHDINIAVDGGEAQKIRAVDCEYRNNTYVSLRDMAQLLKGTGAEFAVEVTSDLVAVTFTGSQEERTLTGWQEDELAVLKCKEVATNRFTVNDSDRKYYNLRAAYGDGVDCFLRPVNLCMMLGINIEIAEEDSLRIRTDSVLNVTPQELEEDGYFNDVSTVLVGDATTGQVYYEYRGDEEYPIASISKLMTYLLVEEALARGEITEDDVVTVTSQAEEISASKDGEIPMKAGDTLTVRELITGALLPSSNECAHLLAEKVGGDVDYFVELMNNRAKELKMTKTHFNNPSGLPSYNSSGIPSKRQNCMSAEDLFILCSYILNNYPQIKTVTGQKFASLPSLKIDVKNTNALLYNIPEVNGMKTGTTDKAGACLVTSLTVNDGLKDHDLVVILLGGENSKVRFTTSEVLAYYAKNVILGNISADGKVISPETQAPDDEVKITASSLVDMIVRGALNRQK